MCPQTTVQMMGPLTPPPTTPQPSHTPLRRSQASVDLSSVSPQPPECQRPPPRPHPPNPPPAHPACQVPPDHFPTGCQSPRTVHTVPEPAPSGPGCYPLPPPFYQDSPHSTYLALCPLPSSYKVLAPSIYKAFLQACERVADDFLASPSELTTLNFLALPKVGLAPGLAKEANPWTGCTSTPGYPSQKYQSTPTVLPRPPPRGW
jgi:hypothetical protein